MRNHKIRAGDGVNSELLESDEKLLVKFFDGEANLWERIRAKRLMAASVVAKEFMRSLEVLSTFARSENCGRNLPTVDLWDKISARINNEEHAAIFLGERRVKEAYREVSVKRWPLERLVWGGCGAAFGAALIYVTPMFNSSSSVQVADSVSSSRMVAQNALVPFRELDQRPTNLKSVGLRQADDSQNLHISDIGSPMNKASSFNQPNSLLPVEVDWMKSDGRVQLVQNAPNRSAIIWVQRRRPVLESSRTPSGREPIVVYNEPRAISVNNPMR